MESPEQAYFVVQPVLPVVEQIDEQDSEDDGQCVSGDGGEAELAEPSENGKFPCDIDGFEELDASKDKYIGGGFFCVVYVFFAFPCPDAFDGNGHDENHDSNAHDDIAHHTLSFLRLRRFEVR